MANFGLLVIAFSWLMQYAGQDDKIQPGFIIFYMIGVAILVADNFFTGLSVTLVLNLCTLGAAWLAFSKVIKRKGTKKGRK